MPVRRRHWPLAAVIMHRSSILRDVNIFPVQPANVNFNQILRLQPHDIPNGGGIDIRHVRAWQRGSHQVNGAENTRDSTPKMALSNLERG
jgi:hypothetical protein